MSKQEILEVLEKNPPGLTISQIAEKAGLHRNTVSSAVKSIDNIKLKEVGKSKIYYLSRYSGLHESKEKRGKNIKVGLGVSDLKDGYKAAVSAAKQAVMQSSHGKQPSFALVFVSSDYNPQVKKVVKGINKILGTKWIGATTDRELNSLMGYSKGTIEVLTLHTKYLHFGVGVSEDYRKDPVKEGEKTIHEAIDNCPTERSKFATAQFMRGSKKDFKDIIRNPPYFILTFPGGTYFKNKKPTIGMESEFLEGIKMAVGSYIPILGASSSSDIDKILKGKGINYVFANGKYYKRGAVTCFVVSDLYFSYNLEHPYVSTDKYATITKISEDGRNIKEINNKPAVDEYCKLVGIDKKNFLKARMLYQCQTPILVFDTSGNIFPIATGANADGKSLFSYQRLQKNFNIKIGKYDEHKSLNASSNSIRKFKGEYKNKKGLCLLFSCMGRRIMLKGEISEFFEKINNELGEIPYMGFYSNGEIGAKQNRPSRYNNFTDTFIIIFDELITE